MPLVSCTDCNSGPRFVNLNQHRRHCTKYQQNVENRQKVHDDPTPYKCLRLAVGVDSSDLSGLSAGSTSASAANEVPMGRPDTVQTERPSDNMLEVCLIS